MPGENVPQCLSVHLDDYRRCAYSRSTGFGASMGSREQFAQVASGASIVDLTEEVCPGTGSCPVVIDGMIAWRDTNHLSATFSATLAPEMGRQLVADFPSIGP